MTATLPTRSHSKPLLAFAGLLGVALITALAIGIAGPRPIERCTQTGAQALALERTRDEFGNRGKPGHFRWLDRNHTQAWVFVRDRLTDQSRLLDESCLLGRWRVTSDQAG